MEPTSTPSNPLPSGETDAPRVDAPAGQVPPESQGEGNVVEIGQGAQVEQIAVGSYIQQIKNIGYTPSQFSTLLSEILTEYQPKPFDGRSPYVGLASFQESDADRFFGRETLIAELVGRIAAVSNSKQARAVFVAGPSGSGKSSVVRAGLVPALKGNAQKTGAVPGSERWLFQTLKPGRTPLDEFGLVAARLADSRTARQDFSTHGLTDPTLLHQWADIALQDDPRRRAVVFIDQFEEVFTQVASEAERVAFLKLLVHAATVENGRVLLLLTLRSDFVSNCASYPELNALLNQQFLQVGAMTPDELVSAIMRPALQVGLRIDPALVAQIVSDVRSESGALPLMQFALQDLFDAEKQKGQLTLDGYIERGGLSEALERHADTEFAKLDDNEKELARTVFAGLIQIGRGTQDTKRTALFNELVPAGVDAARVQSLVRELADARLITIDEIDHQETLTLAHEKLLDAWEWLRRLVNENREAIALQNEIAGDAQEWEQHARDASYLYTGARLATAQEKLDQKKLVLSGLAQEFTDASIAARDAERAAREAERQRELERERLRADAEERARLEADKRAASEKQRARILRVAALGLSALLVVAIIASCLAFRATGEATQQRDAANQSNATAVAEANARATAEGLSKLDAARAEQARVTAVGEANARATAEGQAKLDAGRAEQARATAVVEAKISRSRELAAIAVHELVENATRALLIAIPANEAAVTFESENALRQALLHVQTLRATLTGHSGPIKSAQFSPDGSKIVTASEDSSARLWEAPTGKLVATLAGHEAAVNSAQFSPGGGKIVTSSDDRTARLWDALTGKELAVLRGHLGQVTSAEFSPDGSKIVTASQDGTARIWDGTIGVPLAVLSGHQNFLFGAVFSSDGKKVLTWSYDHTARLWDVSAGKELLKLDEPSLALSAAISPDDSKIVTGEVDGTISFWDSTTGTALPSLTGHSGTIRGLKFSHDGRKLLSASDDYTARVWDLAKAETVSLFKGHSTWVKTAEFSPDDSRIVTASDDSTARLWDAGTGEELAILRAHAGRVASAEFSPDGTEIVTAGDDASARIWDSQTDQEFFTLPVTAGSVRSAHFSPDSTQLLTTSDDNARLWQVVGRRQPIVLEANKGRPNAAQFSPDGKRIVTADTDATARVWDAVNGKALTSLEGHGSVTTTHLNKVADVNSAQFSPDGRRIVTASVDKTARVWDVFSGKELVVLQGHTESVVSARFSPDGSKILTTSEDNTSRIWDAGTGKELVVLDSNHYYSGATFSPDGSKLVIGTDDQTAQVRDTTTGKELVTLRGHTDRVVSARFSPDGTKLLTESFDGTARLWDATSGTSLAILAGVESFDIDSPFSPDGSKIVLPGSDNIARIWDAATGKEITALPGQDGIISSAEFSSDGSMIVTTSTEGTARLHLARVSDLLGLAKRRLGGLGLTCLERVQYLRQDSLCATPTAGPVPTPTPSP